MKAWNIFVVCVGLGNITLAVLMKNWIALIGWLTATVYHFITLLLEKELKELKEGK